MKKKLLVVMLALALVLAFSSLAMAADKWDPNDSLSTDAFTVTVDEANTASFVYDKTAGEPAVKYYNVYSMSQEINLTFVPKENITLDVTNNKLKLTNSATVTATKPAENQGDDPVIIGIYTFTLINLNDYTITIDSKLYDGNGAEYKKSGDSFLVPTNLSKVYAKITVTKGNEPAGISEYEVEGADKATGAIPIDDFTESTEVTVKIGGFERSQEFDMLRPTLQYIDFNDTASSEGAHELTIKSGVYTYKTDDGYVGSGWSRVYIKPVAVCDDAEVTVKLDGATNPLSKSGDWYYQYMGSDVYKLTATVTVGTGADAIKKDYTIYLMAEDYEGPTVKTFKANEKSTGAGDDYLTVIDQESKTIYVFLPDGEDEFYAYVTMNGDIKDDTLRLEYSFKEGKWSSNAIGTGTKDLKYKDRAGLEYKYTVKITEGNKKYHDATLKSLTVKSGSRANTARTVDIDFDPAVTDYAFPVTDRDVWLNIAAKANDSNATVFINGQQATSITETKLDTDEVTEYEILVVAGDGVTTETYTVTVNGSTGLLQSLSASNVVGLTPAFVPDVNTYTTYTAAGTNSTDIVALAKNYSSDYVQISKANFNAYGQVTSYTALTRAVQGGTSQTCELKTGTNIFRVDVLSSASATSAKASYYLTINVPTADPKCVVSSQKLYINGKAQTLSAYNIAGNNYLKLRDVAALLDGTVKEMKVDWDASKWTASMVMPGTFSKRGDELTTLTPPSKYALSTQYFTYNAKPVFPLAYNVTGTGDATGSNYVMLRDVASLLDFGVTYTPNTQTINISTSNEYTPGL